MLAWLTKIPGQVATRRSAVSLAAFLFLLGGAAERQAAKARAPQTAALRLADPRLQFQAGPSLDGGVAWLNTEKPLSLADLRGRVVLLDFWTLC
jgi:hypothetical protein